MRMYRKCFAEDACCCRHVILVFGSNFHSTVFLNRKSPFCIFFFFFLKHRHFQEAKVNGTFSCFLDPYSNLRTCNTTVLTEKTQFKVEKEWPHELPTALCWAGCGSGNVLLSLLFTICVSMDMPHHLLTASISYWGCFSMTYSSDWILGANCRGTEAAGDPTNLLTSHDCVFSHPGSHS